MAIPESEPILGSGNAIIVGGHDSAVGYEPTADEEEQDRISDETLVRLGKEIPSIPEFIASIDVAAVGQSILDLFPDPPNSQ